MIAMNSKITDDTRAEQSVPIIQTQQKIDVASPSGAHPLPPLPHYPASFHTTVTFIYLFELLSPSTANILFEIVLLYLASTMYSPYPYTSTLDAQLAAMALSFIQPCAFSDSILPSISLTPFPCVFLNSQRVKNE